jgi:hypothetical protein
MKLRLRCQREGIWSIPTSGETLASSTPSPRSSWRTSCPPPKLPARIAAVPNAPGNHAPAADGFRPAANEGT